MTFNRLLSLKVLHQFTFIAFKKVCIKDKIVILLTSGVRLCGNNDSSDRS